MNACLGHQAPEVFIVDGWLEMRLARAGIHGLSGDAARQMWLPASVMIILGFLSHKNMLHSPEAVGKAARHHHLESLLIGTMKIPVRAHLMGSLTR
jgi:hypothetical protein